MATIFTAYAVNNNCFKAASRLNAPKGIVVHSTGANNPNLSRYVDAPDTVGVNALGNTWNTPKPGGREVCVHAFVGKDKNGRMMTANILPYYYRCWGCGSGSRGTFNSSHIQFEICEDGLNDLKYFEAAFSEAIEYCAVLCEDFSLPVSSIVSHAEAHRLGYASNHADCDHWLKKFGRDMDWYRRSVQVILDQRRDNLSYADRVCRKCGFTDGTRAYLDRYAYSADLWRKLWEAMK